MQTNTLFITVMNREIKIEKFRLGRNEKYKLSLSFSVLNCMFFRKMKRVVICTNHTVIIARRVYDIFS